MHIHDLAGKSICILGYGLEGRAMAEALEKYAPGCRITVADQNPQLQATRPTGSSGRASYKLQVGPGYLQNLDRFDVLIKSPGIPPSLKLEAFRLKLSSPTQIFLDSIANTGSMVIGVTGSKGKSTTASLIHAILKHAGEDSYLIGNIGTPAISFIEQSKPNTIFVQEMSSYQLMDVNRSPQIAVVTAFFPEHLDYHGSLEAYLEAKKHIARFQKPDDRVFFNGESEECRSIADEGKGRKIAFSAADSPVRIEQTRLIGQHNLSNIAAAFKVASSLDIPEKTAIEAICEFQGLPHRLQSIGIHNGIEWVDDSISTNPQSAIEALNALGNRVETVILGGQDRGFDFTPLAKRIANSKVQTVILLPESGQRIRETIEKTGAKVKCIEVKTMEEAVRQAKKASSFKLPVRPGHPGGQATSNPPTRNVPIVLLSPASPSYGHFKNFEDRGGQFKNAALKS